MTIYKTEGRIYSPKTTDEEPKPSDQASQPLKDCHECSIPDCQEQDCDCPCDCEAQHVVAPRVVRRQRPCSTWALAAICTVTVGLSFLLVGLLYMATRPEFRKPADKGNWCGVDVNFNPYEEEDTSYLETLSVEEEEEIETIEVPKFNNNNHLTIMSDFRIQMTAFRDNDDNTCFLLDHSNALFETPHSVLEFMKVYQNGEHLTQLDTIYARMEVQGPAVNLTMMATSIRSHCFQISTFWLHSTEIQQIQPRIRREVAGSSQNCNYLFFNGKNVVCLDLGQKKN